MQREKEMKKDVVCLFVFLEFLCSVGLLKCFSTSSDCFVLSLSLSLALSFFFIMQVKKKKKK